MLALSLLISGNLGFIIFQQLLERGYPIKAVFTNKNSTPIIDCCQEQGIPLFVGNPRKGRTADFIKSIDCDVLLSVNYLFLIERDLITWPRLHAVNLHGSLLPKYRGRTPHVWAIINGEKETGITAHLIDEELDNGAIIKQVKVRIEPDETGADILEKFNRLYPPLVFDVLTEIAKGNLELQSQDLHKALYFGKRTPEDGRIIWDWSRERIRNWIRAQARPYPGAFAFLNGSKVIINKASFDDLGIHYNQSNGSILACNHQYIIVKTPNGALRLEQIEMEKPVNWESGQILN